jgi:regulator of protease activity HflC (stomatin/prohibitin superfamily)
MEFSFIFLLILVVAVIAVLYSGVKQVPQGFQWTVLRFGRYHATLLPGLNLIMPFIDRIGIKMNVQEAVLLIDTQSVITKDNASVDVDGVVFYQIFEAAKATYEVQNLENAIKNLALTNIRTAIGALDLDETLSKRDEINTRLLHVMDAATTPWGTKITRVELKDISPLEDVLNSMRQQLSAERERRANILQAEGKKQSAILVAEGQKQAVILEAEARLAAAIKDADARVRLAEAEATATKAVSSAVEEGNVQALNYFIAQKYVQAVKAIGRSSNAKVVLMPLEATALVGTVAGIGELAKAAIRQSASDTSDRAALT